MLGAFMQPAFFALRAVPRQRGRRQRSGGMA